MTLLFSEDSHSKSSASPDRQTYGLNSQLLQNVQRPESRQFEVTKNSGSLRSIYDSVARNTKVSNTFDEKRFLSRQPLKEAQTIDVEKKVADTIVKLEKKAKKRIDLMRTGTQE